MNATLGKTSLFMANKAIQSPSIHHTYLVFPVQGEANKNIPWDIKKNNHELIKLKSAEYKAQFKIQKQPAIS